MTVARPNVFARLYQGETSFDFAGRWRRWFVLSGTVILIGLLSVGVRGLNFSVDFKGGTIWQVPTSASVAQVHSAVDKAVPSLASSAVITVLTNHQTGKRTVEVQASAKATTNNNVVIAVSGALAGLAHTNGNDVAVNGVGASWGANITHKAVKAVIIFLIAVSIYIWLRFEGKMAIAALVALLHDILVTIGIYSLSGFQVSPDTVIAFLTILGYSLYDTIVVFDKVQENTRSVASSAKFTYTDYVNLSMNQVLARSLNTSFVAIIPILAIEVIGAWILGASTLNDFGLALLIGLTTGAYSSIFIASPLLALLKEREPRYADIRRRMAQVAPRRVTPAAAAASRGVADTGGGAGSPSRRARLRAAAPSPVRRATTPRRGASAPGDAAPLANGGAPAGSRTGSHTAGTPARRSRTGSQTAGTPAPGSRSGSQPRGSQAPGSQAPGSQAPASQAPGSQAPGSRPPGSQPPGFPAPGSGRGAVPAPGFPAPGSGRGAVPAGSGDGPAEDAPTPGDAPGPGTPVPPRARNRPPPRPRKKRRR